jgi:hypothetical protein
MFCALSATDEVGRAVPSPVSTGSLDAGSGWLWGSVEGVAAAALEYRMLEETADGENGFQVANKVLV